MGLLASFRTLTIFWGHFLIATNLHFFIALFLHFYIAVDTNEDNHLLRDILRDEWVFDGVVVSDWGGSNDHVKGVQAGSHLEMPAPSPCSDLLLVEAVKNGTLDETLLDERVDEYLNVVFSTVIPKNAPTDFHVAAHHVFAQRTARESIVLLKNETDILPLPNDTKVAVIGDFAKVPRY